MRLTKTHAFAASCDEVFAVMTDVDFHRARIDGVGESPTAEVVEADGQTVVTISRQLDTAAAPDVVKRLVGRRLTVVEVRDWGRPREDGGRSASLDLQVTGAPVTMSGTVDLAPSAEGCLMSLVGDVRCTIPLIGRSFEDELAGGVGAAVEDEVRAVEGRLGE